MKAAKSSNKKKKIRMIFVMRDEVLNSNILVKEA